MPCTECDRWAPHRHENGHAIYDGGPDYPNRQPIEHWRVTATNGRVSNVTVNREQDVVTIDGENSLTITPDSWDIWLMVESAHLETAREFSSIERIRQ